MANEFLQKHEKTINTAIQKNPVEYTTSSGKNTQNTAHCYFLKTKTVTISSYAIKNNAKNAVSKYIVKITIASDTKKQKSFTVIKNSAQFAKTIHRLLAEKHDEQINKTLLKNNFHNRAFTKKR